ncbi:copper amine oxidase N-terminal domain-containing protein [Paenibacillus daejeonensis]|uniref:copper amine oxidase N-terminal domain-containing protein n=1 Tax=Paenibacillus daejeonensis TaxID=135193 RepID=UPI0012FCA3E1|nr:copper amine oxidase N-terminal domain-containing protein [Paenibacillus daejeonensis]
MSWRRVAGTLSLCVGLTVGLVSVSAEENVGKKTLPEAFDQSVIVPYDYQGKAFVNGVKTDIWGEYEIVQRQGRVMVPIRLMGTLAGHITDSDGMWQADWSAERPDEVVLRNGNLGLSIKFTVGERTMVVGQEKRTIDIAPQRIGDRIVLPLRSAAEALNTRIEWLDGLIVMSEEPIDLVHPQTSGLVSRVKKQLVDARPRLDWSSEGQMLNPLTMVGSTVYYTGIKDANSGSWHLYKRGVGQQTGELITLPGNPQLGTAKLVGQELFFLTQTEQGTSLYAYHLGNESIRKISDVANWDPTWGWLGEIRYIDGELYVILHYGDNTMGSDTLYLAKDGRLEEVTWAKSFINYAFDDAFLYATDFRFMYGMENNLFRVDKATGERSDVGVPEYAYGVIREYSPTAESYRHHEALYIRDGIVYALGYLGEDRQDVAAVYRIDPESRTHTKLTGHAEDFWLIDEHIYYVDGVDGFLKAVDKDGGESWIVLNMQMKNVQFVDGSFYFMKPSHPDASTGVLYQYFVGQFVAQNLLKQRSELPVSSYEVGKSGLYYIQQGYDPGLFKVGADGRSTRLVSDNVHSTALSDDGIVYTLAYEKGIFSGK